MNIIGPGVSPCRTSAEIKMAAITLPGMPSANSGTKLAGTTALSALSAAATPSIMPVPNFSGVFEARCVAP